jgi:hypothetical protein
MSAFGLPRVSIPDRQRHLIVTRGDLTSGIPS